MSVPLLRIVFIILLQLFHYQAMLIRCRIKSAMVALPLHMRSSINVLSGNYRCICPIAGRNRVISRYESNFQDLTNLVPIISNELPEAINGDTCLRDLFKSTSDFFVSRGIPESEDSAMYLLCHVAGIHSYRRSEFFNNQELQLSTAQISTFLSHCQLRLQRLPLQYIIGNWDFYGLNFLCESPVLIPRPETEELVEKILSTGYLQTLKAPRILDIGSGTGAIGIALLSQLPTAECIALDINPVAIRLSNTNADRILSSASRQKYSSRLQSFEDFVAEHREKCNRCDSDSHTSINDSLQFDLVVSNPPYIPSDEMTNLDPEVKLYEDHQALHGGTDGLDLARDIIQHSPDLLRHSRPKGQPCSSELWMELSRRHPKEIEEWMAFSGPHSDRMEHVENINDLTTMPRFVRLKLKTDL